MRNSKYFFIFLIIISFINISKSFIAKVNEEEFPILEYKEKLTFPLNGSEPININFQMNVDTILSGTIYLYVYITDPTNIDFFYKLEKDDLTNYENLYPYIVINHSSDHTVYYKIKKPSGNGYKLYVSIKAYNFNKGQSITVESTESITDIYLLLGIFLGVIILLTFGCVFLQFYYVYKKKIDKSNLEINENVVIARVSPEDYSPLR